MKKIIYLFLPIFVCSISVGQSLPSFEIDQGDTINYTDENNLKQGFWKIFGRMKKLPNYEADQVVEQGNFNNSRKMGLWTLFFPSGKTKSEIEYVNSRPNGKYKIYFENGQLEEEGTWKNNRNIATYKRYHENGQVSQDFAFNKTGKRDGKQVYFYENGQVMIEAEIKEGKEEFVKEYNEDGSVKAEKYFVDGKIDVEKTKIYEAKPNSTDKEPEGVVEIVKVAKDEYVNSGDFKGEGKFKMYNADQQISKDGYFKNYRLMDGKQYVYTGNGILVQIKLFKEGRYIGDAPIPKE